MKNSIENIGPEHEEEIIIRCHEINDEILALMKKLIRVTRRQPTRSMKS